MSEKYTTRSPEETVALGRTFGSRLKPGDVVALWGDLGSGKTTFTRGIAQSLGIPPSIPITSPTFTIINEYLGTTRLYHIDLYRIRGSEDVESIALREILYGNGVSVIEWPDRLGIDGLPENRWDILFDILDENGRLITIEWISTGD
ncbi:MAG: tRNA (adenosine(37)-N6)-threonylcarbamoyltransferase complex ATPase subunit type 1 TsaE [Syntrophobacterales bacterium]|nr:tRNA (adenosine(37)-N6)-threonylcarbamoyltransferase complex ATPase subunit type 1 TsaE [Syntrophobacterales bacterium]